MDTLDIMIVEDDAPLRTIMQLLLEEQPHRIAFVETGAEALQQFSSTKQDVIVIDVGLPDMSGFELARTLRDHSCQAYLVAFTGFDDERTRSQADAAGFDRFFHKPLDLVTMESIFDQIIDAGLERHRQS